MQRRTLLGGISALALLSGAALMTLPAASIAAGAGPEVGRGAPDFQAMDIDGKPVRLADFRGRTVVLEWSNHECPFVRKHYSSGNMQQLQKAATDEGIVWLTIVSSAKGEQGYVSAAEAGQLIADQKAAPTSKLLDPDGRIGRSYGALVTPHMYVIGPDGVLAYMGAIDDKPSTRASDIATARNYVRDALAAVKAGKPADPAVTRAYGCTIKYAS
ncbi:MAG: redoxin domain-containing protein [Alphaproteobacteria bacterium]|nr:redoxin domain-containing protein [Alphaproteobacteria bacterium]